MKKNLLSEYFSFTRKERIAVLILVIIIVGIWFLPTVISTSPDPKPAEDSSWIAKAEALIKPGEDSTKPVEVRKTGRQYVEKKADYKKTYSPISIDINTADTSAFIALPGIGSKLASRIVHFREKLGVFYSVKQVSEVYGIADSVFQKIQPLLKMEKASIKKININTATFDDLKAHPYIRYQLAKLIVAYREQHGMFTNLEDLKKIITFDIETYNKIAPYLSSNEK